MELIKIDLIQAFLIAVVFSISIGQASYANGLVRADLHAPIGVMGDHGHAKGELMLSYRYKRMEMNGNRLGSDNISSREVLQAFPLSPLEMTMEMHMLGAMYGLANNLTLMAMVPYIDKSMELINRMGRKFNTRARGLGDTKIMIMHKLYSKESGDMPHYHLGMGFGFSLPTGSSNKKDYTPLGKIRLPYPMQLGSGTYDPIIGITYVSFYPQWSWGAQFRTVQRFGKNNEGYRLGDEYYATTWAAYRYSNHLSFALRIDGKSWNDISGADKKLNPLMVATARPDLRGGEHANLGIGINFMQPHGLLKGHRIAAEFSIPFYQHLDGPQLEVDYMYTLGWQAVF